MRTRRPRGDLPFAAGEVNRRLNAHLRDGAFPDLSAAEIGLLRALISLADWQTGAIPYSAEQISLVTRMHRDTVSRMRTRLCTLGLLVVAWRTSLQVQYALGPVLRG